jgi:4-carboxymuconolactone decarboxylase
MPRIKFPTPETMTPEQRRVYDEVVAGPRGVVRGPLLAALYNPALADHWQKLGALLRYGTSLPPRLSELAILVTAQRYQCLLEWHLHEAPALKAGLTAQMIEELRHGRRPQFEAEMNDVYDFAAQMHDHRRVDAPTYDRIVARWQPLGAVELTALIGYYTMVAMTLNAHEFELPPGVTPPFPAN